MDKNFPWSSKYFPESKNPFIMSRSKIDLYLRCKRCAYLDMRLGIKGPKPFPYNLNSRIDTLLKKEHDIARNKKIDFYRKTKKKRADDEDIRQFLYQNNKINDYELESSINKIKQELDENQQKLLKMSFFEQKSHKKIAEELEIPLGTDKSRIRSTLNKMQKILS